MPQLIDGRYELGDVIATGGMASVWRARDTRLDRVVAVKRPHPAALADRATRHRMEREARAAAALNHPHVITVYDYGEDESGPFLVMELVDGPTLAEAGYEANTARAIEMGAKLADALAAIHAAGIVHRDVKPANVIMSHRGPLLTDFGIALSAESVNVTDPGKIVATPSYAAPEVIGGNTPTAAADVYSLGVVIAEIASGEGLFSGFDRSVGLPDLGDPQLQAVLGSTLSMDPDERPSAAELGRSLRRLEPTRLIDSESPSSPSSEPTLVMSPPTAYERDRRGPSPRRDPLWVVAAAIALAALALIALTRDDVQTGLAAEPTTSAAPSTSVPPTTQSAPSTTLPAETTAPPADSLTAARDRLATILSQPPRDDLSPREAEDILKKVDEAIAAAMEDKEKEASKKLREAAKAIDEGLGGQRRDDALAALTEIAGLLEVDMEGDDD